MDCKAYPDEKGIETRFPGPSTPNQWADCKAYPDEKGIETAGVVTIASYLSGIAKPIPMKRELKRCCFSISSIEGFNCKAYPDEKGIETSEAAGGFRGIQYHCKAYPDEKGIETVIIKD